MPSDPIKFELVRVYERTELLSVGLVCTLDCLEPVLFGDTIARKTVVFEINSTFNSSVRHYNFDRLL